MTTANGDDLMLVVKSVHNSGDHQRAEELARDMVAAGLSWLRIRKGARYCAELCDGLAQDYTGDVLGQARARS